MMHSELINQACRIELNIIDFLESLDVNYYFKGRVNDYYEIDGTNPNCGWGEFEVCDLHTIMCWSFDNNVNFCAYKNMFNCDSIPYQVAAELEKIFSHVEKFHISIIIRARAINNWSKNGF